MRAKLSEFEKWFKTNGERYLKGYKEIQLER